MPERVVETCPWICGVCVGLDIRLALLIPEALSGIVIICTSIIYLINYIE